MLRGTYYRSIIPCADLYPCCHSCSLEFTRVYIRHGHLLNIFYYLFKSDIHVRWKYDKSLMIYHKFDSMILGGIWRGKLLPHVCIVLYCFFPVHLF